MATVENTTVKIYKGVPLIKGGTEVLYLSQSAAESALASFLFKTYTKYYYTRENRGIIQIEETIDELEGANYVSFVNASHGPKIYFAFIDRLVYINDEVTQVEFTIDPFPTYLGDTTEKEKVFLVRNTVKTDMPRVNLAPDYMPNSARREWHSLSVNQWLCRTAVCFFACYEPDAGFLTDINGTPTGIHCAPLSTLLLQYLEAHNGVIIGAYLIPDAWYGGYAANTPIVRDLGTISGDALAHAAGYTWEKTKSGVYNSIVLRTSENSKEYDLESFQLRTQVTFGVVGLMLPSPSIFIYPKNYCGVIDNLSEGLMMHCPSLPISAAPVYTAQQSYNDMMGFFEGTIAGVIGGAVKGGTVGGLPSAIVGGAIGAASALFTAAKNQTLAKFNSPSVGSMGVPCVAQDYALKAQLSVASPMGVDMNRIDAYFDYFGYALNSIEIPNLDDEAYIQTGEEFLFGSEADAELNARLAAGIKIRKTLT